MNSEWQIVNSRRRGTDDLSDPGTMGNEPRNIEGLRMVNNACHCFGIEA